MAKLVSGRKPTFLLEHPGTPGKAKRARYGFSGADTGGGVVVDLEKIQQVAERVADAEGFFLVDVELKGGRSNPLLRVYIDKPGGVSHADCQLLSEQLSAILDVEDPFPGSYMLEVSSPGLDRQLTKASEFKHFSGRRVRVVLREPLDEQKVFEGRLAGCEAGRVKLDLGEGGGLKELDLVNISKARLLLEW